MALTTRCPQCGTTFKVVPDQLRVRNGLVRCGACSTVFDGRACLLPG
ncbi:zinc-ribbon domain-containing protein, partial [Achromobacter piechaudii]